MKRPVSRQSLIDEANNRLWNYRYQDPKSVIKEAAILLSRSEKAQYLKGIAYARLNIAVCSFLQSQNEIALENLSDALSWLTNDPDEYGYARALNLKGNLFESFGEYEQALQFCLQALKFSTRLNDRETESETCSQLGLIHTRLCNFSKALKYYQEALEIREELKDENAIASSLNRIAMVLRLTKKYDESLKFYFKSLEIRKKNKQITSIPWTLLGLASTFEEMHKHTEALAYYNQAMTDSDKRCTLQCLIGKGRILTLEGKAKEAEDTLLESLKKATELKALALIAEAHAAMAKHYELTGNSEKALQSYKLFQETRESVQSEEAQSRFRNIEISHAIEKSEQEKEIFRLRNVELRKAFDTIEEKNNEITSSINYARRIQQAILPKPAEIKGLKSKLFILYIPKDIISGDFYWFSKVEKKLIVSAGDCTGHGVPGALMSMLGISFLEEIVNNRGITDSGLILDELRKEIQHALHQKGIENEAKDGMDISLCVLDHELRIVQYSGANNNLYLIRDGELVEYQADRMPIGIHDHSDRSFIAHEFESRTGDIVYMFSDGYADQFGGPNQKKFKSAALKSLLIKISNLPLQKQKQILEDEFMKWKGEGDQIDDVTIIGIKL